MIKHVDHGYPYALGEFLSMTGQGGCHEFG
jgi:hypothetical protein